MNKYERSHLKAIAKFQQIVAKYYDISTEQVLQLYERCSGVITSNMWEYMMNQIIQELGNNVQTAIINGITNEWTRANAMNDAAVNKVFTGMTLSKKFQQRYFNNHADALKGFIERVTKGGTLSDRVWNYSNQFATNITRAITYSLEHGTSARNLANEVKHLLKNPTNLAVTDTPGQGVYRSAQKNAMRLARSEINIAYRTADYLRIQDEDFVVGIRVVKSNNHPQDDICDSLSAEVGSEATKGKGCYPKDFKFTGWHPHCRCHTETILKTRDELMRDNQLILQGQEPLPDSQNTVKNLPKEFMEYMDENGKAIAKSGSKPYWYKDNEKILFKNT